MGRTWCRPAEPSISGLQWWGGDTIDLSQCLVAGETLEVSLVTIMAGSTFYVPPGVRVVDRTVSILAGNSISRGAQGDGSRGTLVLKGFSWWGGHRVVLARA